MSSRQEETAPSGAVFDPAGIGWDFECPGSGHYHVYAVAGFLDGRMDAIVLDIPETPENDADVQSIADALRRIALRHRRAGPRDPGSTE